MIREASRPQRAGRSKILGLLTAYCWLISGGCAPKPVVVNTAFDFTKVHRISVAPFEGPGGGAATDAFIKELVQTGMEVTDAKHPGDVVLHGTVTEFKSTLQLMVFLGDGYPMMTGASQETPEQAALGARGTQVATVVATVAIQTRLTQGSSSSIVWADNYSYEGLDLSAAMDAVIDSLAGSMKRSFPQMNKAKPS